MRLPRLAHLCALGCFVLGSLCGCSGQPAQAAPEKPPHIFTIQNKGSDTLVNLALAWAELYAPRHPEVQIAVTGGGSGTGIAALINGTVHLASSSRKIKPEEVAAARANGVEPVQHIVAGDAIAVVVNPRNALERVTIAQLAAIFSGEITNWQDLGCEDRPIVLLSREVNSGTHVYFLEEVVRQGDSNDRTLFATETLLLPSSEGISSEIRRNPNAIGYDGLGYVTPDQKVIGIARDDAGPFVLPTAESVRDGSYPIARNLYMYTIGEPTGPLKEYLDWIHSAEAQQVVLELGFVPIDGP